MIRHRSLQSLLDDPSEAVAADTFIVSGALSAHTAAHSSATESTTTVTVSAEVEKGEEEGGVVMIEVTITILLYLHYIMMLTSILLFSMYL